MEQLILSWGGVPVSPSVSQEEERDWMVSLVSCSSISELYMTFARGGFCGRTCPEYFPSITDGHSEPLSLNYRGSGMAAHGECLTLNSSEWHNAAAVCSLSAVLERSGVPQRFYLSAQACQGILRRAETREKPLPGRLRKALMRQSTPERSDLRNGGGSSVFKDTGLANTLNAFDIGDKRTNELVCEPVCMAPAFSKRPGQQIATTEGGGQLCTHNRRAAKGHK